MLRIIINNLQPKQSGVHVLCLHVNLVAYTITKLGVKPIKVFLNNV